MNPAAPKPTVLVVDDAPENLEVMIELLSPQYRVVVANSGANCLRIASTGTPPDLILLDVMMPEMDGYAVLEKLHENPLTAQIPVIFLTALADSESEEHGLQLGAADYVTKPIRAPILLARVKTQLEAKQSREWLRDKNAVLEAEVARRMVENDLIQKASIRALAHLAETRDPETGNHITRTQYYVRHLAEGLRRKGHHAETLTPHYIDQLSRSAPLHDIGKVGIPDNILLKPGQLTADEWLIMKTHAKLGSDAIEQAEQDIDAPVEFLILSKEIAHWHHERWDGNGYPDQLQGEDIPLAARIMALADVFDALTNKRVYKPAFPVARAHEIIVAERGKHFDPMLVDVFIGLSDEFALIAKRFADQE